ncbi:MAG: hypothetical protein Q8P15_00480 [Nanoarchaeota archaeon]|nr:hypothetical protein [Nanoarchaeota archaeon]
MDYQLLSIGAIAAIYVGSNIYFNKQRREIVNDFVNVRAPKLIRRCEEIDNKLKNLTDKLK